MTECSACNEVCSKGFEGAAGAVREVLDIADCLQLDDARKLDVVAGARTWGLHLLHDISGEQVCNLTVEEREHRLTEFLSKVSVGENI